MLQEGSLAFLKDRTVTKYELAKMQLYVRESNASCLMLLLQHQMLRKDRPRMEMMN